MIVGKKYRVKTLEELRATGCEIRQRDNGFAASLRGYTLVPNMSKLCGKIGTATHRQKLDIFGNPWWEDWMVVECSDKYSIALKVIKNLR